MLSVLGQCSVCVIGVDHTISECGWLRRWCSREWWPVSVTTSVPTTPWMVILPSPCRWRYRPLLLIFPFQRYERAPVRVVTSRGHTLQGLPVIPLVDHRVPAAGFHDDGLRITVFADDHVCGRRSIAYPAGAFDLIDDLSAGGQIGDRDLAPAHPW